MKKNILTIPLLLIALFTVLGGFIYLSKAHADSSLLSVTQDSTGGVADVKAQEVVNEINTLNGVTLNATFLNNPIFSTLIDWSKPLPEEAVGRDNPFAPIGQ